MSSLNFIKDKDFLRALDNDINKTFFVKIEILDFNEIPIKSIEGIVQPGSVINISGSSSVRRTCNLNIVAEEKNNDLTDINYFLSVNKRIRIYEGFKNNISTLYDEYVWFPLGIFVIIQPIVTHSAAGCMIQLSCKDKMCLLNGEYAGGLPTSITFDSYDQIIGGRQCKSNPSEDSKIIPNNYTIYYYDTKENNKTVRHYYSWTEEYGWIEEEDGSSIGEHVSMQQRIYDIIQTLVCNYGGIDINKIFINDVPLQIKQIVRYIGTKILYYNTKTGYYTTDEGDLTTDEKIWRYFSYGDDVGYVYTDFVYPGSLVSSIGDNVCSVLDKIKNTLGNYEYYFDIEGNFIFQEIKNYLNHSYTPVEVYRRLNEVEINKAELMKDADIHNNLDILDSLNYKMDIHSNSKSVYTFNEGSGLVISFSNTPNFSNLKNDFHIWGEDGNNYPIHYHIVVKDKPQTNKNGEYNPRAIIYEKDDNGNYTGRIRLAEDNETPDNKKYVPKDWRAELYLQGLEDKRRQDRPDIYKQELLDLFDSIYDFKEEKFKTDLVYHPNALKYFIDYIEPIDKLHTCSVESLGSRIYSYKQDKLNKLYNTDIPDRIILDLTMDKDKLDYIWDKCYLEGQSASQVNHEIYSQLAIGTSGYTAQEVARELLYQYTNYNESISIQSIPIYYLDVNSRITVEDSNSGIFGDYIINTISLPLNAGNVMTINATRALERI